MRIRSHEMFRIFVWLLKPLPVFFRSVLSTIKLHLCDTFSLFFPEPSSLIRIGLQSKVQTFYLFQVLVPRRAWAHEAFWAASSWLLCSAYQTPGSWRKSYGTDDRFRRPPKNITSPCPVRDNRWFSTTSITSMFPPAASARWTWTPRRARSCSPKTLPSPRAIAPASTPSTGRTRSSSHTASTYHGRRVAAPKTCLAWRPSWAGWRCSREKFQLWEISATVTGHRSQVGVVYRYVYYSQCGN